MRLIRIENLEDEQLDVYRLKNETQLLRFYEPDSGLFIAESPNVIERALAAGYEPVSMLTEEGQIETAGKLSAAYSDLPVYTAPKDELLKLTGFHLTRGLLCVFRRRPLPDAYDLIKDMKRIVVLEDVVNPSNVGAIIRSAAALNMEAVLLTKPCSDPLYRRAARVSMGTCFQVPWTFIEDSWPETGMGRLKAMGFKTAAMALREDSVPPDDVRLRQEEKIAVIMGTEGEGLKDETINSADYTVMIPMSAGVDSLNVAAASAVAFYELGKNKNI